MTDISMALTGTRVTPTFRVTANGTDITAKINERLLTLNLTDGVGYESDTLDIALADDDPFNPIQMPETGAELELFLGYDIITQRMGLFVVDEVELSGWPGQMNIRARAAVYDQSKAGKKDLQTQKSRSWTAGTKFGDLIKRIADEHSMEYAISKSIEGIALPHIDQADESDLNLMLRIAKKYDAVVKPSGGKITVTKRGEGKTASGEELPTITLLATDCTAYRLTSQKRDNAGTVVAQYQLTKKGSRFEVKVGEGEPVKRIGKAYPTKEQALDAAKAELARRSRNQVTIAVSLPGDPSIAAECKLVLVGFREGIDGEWLITRADHRLDQNAGYACDVEATKPNSEEEPNVEVVEHKRSTSSSWNPDDDGPGHVITE